tara:strand:- start:77 stop:1426 length:1350 start_codon:yes stop_codon:yes gene_type:complete
VIKIHLINPVLIKRLKHRNYAIKRFLDACKIDYQLVEQDPDWIVIHPLFGNYLVNDKNILSNLSKQNLQRFKQGECSLLVWYPYETEHYGHPNVRRQIEACLDAVQYKRDKVFLVTGNLNANFKSYPFQKVKDWYNNMTSAFFDYVGKISPSFLSQMRTIRNKHQHIEVVSLRERRILDDCKKLPFPQDFSLEKIQDQLTREQLVDIREPVKSIPLLFFDWQLHDFLDGRGETDQLQSKDSYKKIKSKSFMCLNGKDKHTRRYLLDKLPIDKGHVSYVCYDGIDPHVRSKTAVPIILDQEQHSIRRNDRWMNPEIYHDAYINVVTEAFPDKEIDCFITEKTFKPMLHLQPFMIQGNRYTLRRLREAGYQTFNTLWDESYDELETWQERTDAMVEQLNMWCALSPQQQYEKCQSVWQTLLHNQQMVVNTSADLTRSAYLNDILRAVSEGG